MHGLMRFIRSSRLLTEKIHAPRFSAGVQGRDA